MHYRRTFVYGQVVLHLSNVFQQNEISVKRSDNLTVCAVWAVREATENKTGVGSSSSLYCAHNSDAAFCHGPCASV